MTRALRDVRELGRFAAETDVLVIGLGAAGAAAAIEARDQVARKQASGTPPHRAASRIAPINPNSSQTCSAALCGWSGITTAVVTMRWPGKPRSRLILAMVLPPGIRREASIPQPTNGRSAMRFVENSQILVRWYAEN